MTHLRPHLIMAEPGPTRSPNQHSRAGRQDSMDKDSRYISGPLECQGRTCHAETTGGLCDRQVTHRAHAFPKYSVAERCLYYDSRAAAADFTAVTVTWGRSHAEIKPTNACGPPEPKAPLSKHELGAGDMVAAQNVFDVTELYT